MCMKFLLIMRLIFFGIKSCVFSYRNQTETHFSLQKFNIVSASSSEEVIKIKNFYIITMSSRESGIVFFTHRVTKNKNRKESRENACLSFSLAKMMEINHIMTSHRFDIEDYSLSPHIESPWK